MMNADDEPTTLSNSSSDVLAKIKQLSNNYDSDKNLDEVLLEEEEEATITVDHNETKAVDPMEDVPLSAPPVPAANNYPLRNSSESPLLTREQLRLPLTSTTTPLTTATTTATTMATTMAATTATTTTAPTTAATPTVPPTKEPKTQSKSKTTSSTPQSSSSPSSSSSPPPSALPASTPPKSPPRPTARVHFSSKEMEFYGQLHRALDYGGNDSIALKDVHTFLKRSKLPDHVLQKAWTLAASSNHSNTPPSSSSSASSSLPSTDTAAPPSSPSKLHRQHFWICLKLIALAQYKAFNGEDGAKISLLQLVQETSATDTITRVANPPSAYIPLANFGLRACAAAEALTPRYEIDAIQRDVTTSRGGLSIHVPKHETTDHTSYQITTHVDRGATSSNYSEYPADNVVVWRRFNDFRWLHETLCIRYPGTIIPPLPATKTFGNMDFSFIKERQAELEFFLQSIVQHPTLQQSFYLKIFLVASRNGLEAGVQITNESKRILSAVVGAEGVEALEKNSRGTGGTARSGNAHYHQQHNHRNNESKTEPNQAFSDVSSTTTAAATAVTGLWTWAYGRIKEKVTDQITIEPKELTSIVGTTEEAAYETACSQLTAGTADLASILLATQNMLVAQREKTYQLFLVGESLQQLSQMEFDRGKHHHKELRNVANLANLEGANEGSNEGSNADANDNMLIGGDLSTTKGEEKQAPLAALAAATSSTASMGATAAIEYPSDLSEIGNMLETLANLETELHDDTVQRFLTPIRQCATQTEAARIVLDNYVRLVEELGRARASAKHYKNVYQETKLKVGGGSQNGRMSPSSLKRAEEDGEVAKRMEGDAYKRALNAKEQLIFLVSNFPHEVSHMRSKCNTVLGGVLLERGRAQIQHERQTRTELERVRDVLLVGDVIGDEELKAFHQWRDQQMVPPPLPGVEGFEEGIMGGTGVQPRFDSQVDSQPMGGVETAASTAAAFMKKWWK